MKHILLMILTLTCLHPTSLRAQFAKQTIDEELLSGLVQAKQEEVRTRVLTNFITKNLPEADHATYNTLADLLDILTTEKNKGAMTRDFVSVVSEYAIAYGVTWYFIQTKRILRRTGSAARPGISTPLTLCRSRSGGSLATPCADRVRAGQTKERRAP